MTFPEKTPRVPYEICAKFQEEQEVFEVFLSRPINVKTYIFSFLNDDAIRIALINWSMNIDQQLVLEVESFVIKN